MSNDLTISLKTGITSSIIQVSSLLWLRTATIYQHKYGGGMINTISFLYKNGGIIRFYRGYFPCLLVASTCKSSELFGYYSVKKLNLSINNQSLYITSISNLGRILIVPLDTLDTFYQLYGSKGYSMLNAKIKNNGLGSLYNGSLIWLFNHSLSTYIWFNTFKRLEKYTDNKYNDNIYMKNIKNGFIGYLSSICSDIFTNPFRVIKTNKQGSFKNISYYESLKDITKNKKSDLLFRGLSTRIVTHGIQSAFFVIIWKNLEEYFNI